MAYAAHQRMAAAAAALASAPPGSAGGALPYVCNWVAGTPSFQFISYSIKACLPNREYCQCIHWGWESVPFSRQKAEFVDVLKIG